MDVSSTPIYRRSFRPKVLSAKELEKDKTPVDFTMYDAIPADEPSMEVDDSSEMDKFLPMLNDYLKSEFHQTFFVFDMLTCSLSPQQYDSREWLYDEECQFH